MENDDFEEILFNKKEINFNKKLDSNDSSFFSNENQSNDINMSNHHLNIKKNSNREIDLFGVKKVDSNLNIFNDNSK